MWIAPTAELEAAKARRKAGVDPPGYPEASSVSLGAVRPLSAGRERAKDSPAGSASASPEPTKENT